LIEKMRGNRKVIPVTVDLQYLLLFVPFIYGNGMQTRPLIPEPFIDLLHQFWMIDDDECGTITGMIEWQGKQKNSVKIYPSFSLSTTSPTLLDPDSNTDRHSQKLVTKSLSHGTICSICHPIDILFLNRNCCPQGSGRFRAETSSSVLSKVSEPVHNLKNGVFCDITPCGSCKNRRFGGT
jgi:hypothetical protein